MNHFFSKYRLLLSKCLLFSIILILIISKNNFDNNSIPFVILEFSGFFLVIVGVFGRIWSSLYIEGNKTNSLVTNGIYSICRNPLYFFSFLLLLGYCLLIKSFIVSFMAMLMLIIVYPRTIKYEEEKLLKIHGDDYLNYFNNTPKFIPNLFLFKKTEKSYKIKIDINKIENVLIESLGFILFFEIIRLLNYLHNTNILPSIINIY